MHGLGAAPVARSYGIFLLALVPSAAAGIGLDFALGSFSDGFALSGILQAVVSVAAIGGGMAVVYFGVLTVMRTPELTELTAPVIRRLRSGR
jgi:putative peptidoglycan lipid II flippase